MRITRRIVRHHDFFNFLRHRVVTADQTVEISGVPDDAVRADDQIVRSRAVFQLNAYEFAGFCIKIRKIPTTLADKPDRCGAFGKRITRDRVIVRHLPFLYIQTFRQDERRCQCGHYAHEQTE